MTGLYDLHTHTILSDGEMLPSELVRRMAVLGYTTVAITDHVDTSNAASVVRSLLDVRESARLFGVRLLCGVEITHVPPSQIAAVARRSREAGADIVIVHGETTVEPVAPGTNHAACACREVNVLAHPGLITHEDARLCTGEWDRPRDHFPVRAQPHQRSRGAHRTRDLMPDGSRLGRACAARFAGQDRQRNRSAGCRSDRCRIRRHYVFKYRPVPPLLKFLFILSRNI